MKFFIWRTYTLLSPLLPILPGPPARKDFIFGSGNNICLHFIFGRQGATFSPSNPPPSRKKFLFWNALKLISLQEWFEDGTLTADVACFWKELNSHSIQSIYVYNYSRHAQPSHYVIAISETSVMNPPHHEFMTSKWSKYAALKECEARTLSKGKDGLGRPLSFIGGERLCCSICSAYGGLTSPFTYPCRRPGRLDRHWNHDLMESKSPFQLMCNFAMIAEALEWNAPASRMQHFICRQRSADWPATTPGAPALFCDLTNEIKELNTHIIEWNEVNHRRNSNMTDAAPHFHIRLPTKRIRRTGPKYCMETVLCHHLPSWREHQITDKLQLRHAYFMAFYGIIRRLVAVVN